MAKKDLSSKPIKRLTMAEQMADSIKEMVLVGDLEPGDVLPTEAELCDQFGVSRAVVRDATRILMALGLVDVKHGAGVFVTKSQSAAFGEALLIALRRAGATVWDVEEFEQILMPEVIGLAASSATDEEVEAIRNLLQEYHQFVLQFHTRSFEGHKPTSNEMDRLLSSAKKIWKAIVKASHNRVVEQLSEPMLSLKSLRYWEDDPNDTPESLTEMEMLYFNTLVNAIASRDPEYAREQAKKLMALPAEAIEIMKRTEIGKQPKIPISATGLVSFLKSDQ